MPTAEDVTSRLGHMLVAEGLVSKKQIDDLLESVPEAVLSRKRPGEIFLEKGLVGEEDLTRLMGTLYNLPVMRLDKVHIRPAILRLIPEALARRHRMIPLFLVESELTLAVTQPLDQKTLDQISRQTACTIAPVLISRSDADMAFGLYYTEAGAEGDESREKSVRVADRAEAGEVSRSEVEQLMAAGKTAPVIKIVDEILAQAAQEGASDVHIEPGAENLTIRFRVDGILQTVRELSATAHPAVVSRVKIMAELDIAERQKPQDGRIELTVGSKELDLRVSTLPTVFGEKVVLRLLNRQSVQVDLDVLGFSAASLETIKRLSREPYGLILVTGPTGSGKSTTLYAALNFIKSPELNIVTVEDPVEYQLPGINQVPVNRKKDVTFATALRSILRQDPDIILVGEIRDPETGNIACEAALTGHLVLSTLHTNDAPSALTRLLEMGIEPFLVAPSLLMIIGQRLVRTICPACAEEVRPSRESLAGLGLADLPPDVAFHRGRGCDACGRRGYKGRTGIHEVLVMDETLREMIAARATANAIRKYAHERLGFRDMRLDGLKKVFSGITTVEEVIRVTRDAR
jgi:type IV pilus assembly protein PilB